MIFYIILICFLIIHIKFSYDLVQFNPQAKVIQLQSLNPITISQSIQQKSPIIIYNTPLQKSYDFLSISKSNPGYIIQDNHKQVLLQSIIDSNTPAHTYQNKQLSNDIFLTQDLQIISDQFKHNLSFNESISISLMKHFNSLPLSKVTNDLYIFYQVYGNTTFYLINPKHKLDIQNKSNSQIKK